MALQGNDPPNIFFSNAGMKGNTKYDQMFALAEDLSDPELSLNLDCIRSGLINHDKDDQVVMIPVFSRTYGMLVNNDLFKKEGLSVPSTWTELLTVCEAFHSKGYTSPMMGYSLKSSGCFMNTVAYPAFAATLASNPEALELANALDPAAGEYMRPALNTVEQLIRNGCIDLNACDEIEDNYTQVILRFFEGDVPMMICTGDTVSGTKKRESQSEAFINAPFEYSFSPIPLTDDGGYFIDSPSIEFSVNKNCDNPDMTNEFMRFLITKEELNEEMSHYVGPYRYYQRLIAIKFIIEGNTISDASKLLNLSYQTVHRWAKTCEKEGLEGLKPSFGGGRPSKLSYEELIELDKIIENTPDLSMKDVQLLIKEKFNVDYSLKQIGVITKKLGYNYSKAYPIFKKAPKDAEEQLKKT